MGKWCHIPDKTSDHYQIQTSLNLQINIEHTYFSTHNIHKIKGQTLRTQNRQKLIHVNAKTALHKASSLQHHSHHQTTILTPDYWYIPRIYQELRYSGDCYSNTLLP